MAYPEDHGPMKQASERKLSELNDFVDRRTPEGPERTIKYHLYTIAETFSQAQQDRNEADYNLLSNGSPRFRTLCAHRSSPQDIHRRVGGPSRKPDRLEKKDDNLRTSL
jgi:hypothetical protein